MTAREHAALAVARRALAPLEGTWLATELDALLARARGTEADAPGVLIALGLMRFDPSILAVLHQAVTQARCLRLTYRGAQDTAAKARTVHPVRIDIVDQQPYLIAWDEQRRDLRTFKVARVSRAQILRTKSNVPSGAAESQETIARSVKVWRSNPADVRVRISADVARFVGEWPLVPGQKTEAAPNGAIDICARVNGLEETVRWTLRWGKNARAIEPAALVARMREELASALAGYGDDAKKTQMREASRPRTVRGSKTQ
jgi:proteasome accessory factor C